MNACWVEQFIYRVYCDVVYQLKQFARNQQSFLEKKQIYLCIGIGKFSFCRPRHTNGKHVILLPYSPFARQLHSQEHS